MKKKGTLYAIGVGPGDPELITLKAKRILETVKSVFSATSNPKKESLALKIVSPHLNHHSKILPLVFPMTRDEKSLECAWQAAAKKVLSVLDAGEDAAFVTLGDPCTYSTFTYLHRTVTEIEPEIEIEIVPGITSFQAAAARLKIPLTEAEESLVVVSGAKGGMEISRAAKKFDNLVIMKAYRHYDEIVRCLDELGLLDNTVAVRRVGLSGESITSKVADWNGNEPSYFTLLITKKGETKKKLQNH